MKAKAVQYIRVSTSEQNTSRQESILFGKQVYTDKCSGSVAFKKRVAGAEILELAKNGAIEEIHVHSIDRLGRNTLDIMETIQLFTSLGVNVISTKEGLRTLNDDKSENMVSKMIIGILGTLAEFELSRIKERQKEGIEKAKERGTYKTNGRPKGSGESVNEYLNKPKIKKVVRELKKNRSLRETALICQCSLSTVQKVQSYLRMLDESNETAEENTLHDYVPFVAE